MKFAVVHFAVAVAALFGSWANAWPQAVSTPTPGKSPDASRPSPPVARQIVVQRRYLNLPVKNNAPVVRMSVSVDGRKVRVFDIQLADGTPDFWAFIDASAWKGKTAAIAVEKPAVNPKLLRRDRPDRRDQGQRHALSGEAPPAVSLQPQTWLDQRSQRHGLP